MHNSRLVGSAVFILKKKKTVLITVLVCIAAILSYVMFFCPRSTQSSIISLNNSDDVNTVAHSENVTSNAYYINSAEIGGYSFFGSSSNEIVNYIENLKASKIISARQNPYREVNLFNENELNSLVCSVEFKDFLAANGIGSDVSIVANSSSITVNAKSKKSDNRALMNRVYGLMCDYISNIYAERIESIRANHAAWAEEDLENIKVLISEYENLAAEIGDSEADILSCERAREILNEYAAVAVDYEICCAVVEQSERCSKIDLEPVISVSSSTSVGDSKLINAVVYSVIAAICGFVLGIIIAYLIEFFKKVAFAAKAESDCANCEISKNSAEEPANDGEGAN